MGECNLFGGLSSDVNLDGAFTITDLLNNLWHLLLLPGELYATIVRLFMGNFFEMTCTSYESWFWIVISVIAWVVFVGSVINAVLQFFNPGPKAE